MKKSKQLIEDIGSSDPRRKNAALDHIMKATKGMPRWISFRYRIDLSIAEDCFIEAIDLLRKEIESGKFTYQNNGGIRRFLRLVATRKAQRSKQRKPGSKNTLDITELEPGKKYPEIAHREDFLESIIQSEAIEKCLSLLKQMGERCRQILDSIYLQGLSISKCAKIMAITEGNLRVTKFRCLREIRDEMSKTEGE